MVFLVPCFHIFVLCVGDFAVKIVPKRPNEVLMISSARRRDVPYTGNTYLRGAPFRRVF